MDFKNSKLNLNSLLSQIFITNDIKNTSSIQLNYSFLHSILALENSIAKEDILFLENFAMAINNFDKIPKILQFNMLQNFTSIFKNTEYKNKNELLELIEKINFDDSQLITKLKNLN
jgi:hypothetical protein